MDLKEIGRGMLGKIQIGLMKNAPDIKFFGGLGCVGVGTVMACSATMHLNDILEEHQAFLQEVRDAKNNMSGADLEAHRKEFDALVAKRYFKTFKDIGKLYALPVAIELLGAASLVSSRNEYKERNAELAAAVAAIGTHFKDYRANVREQLGEEAEKDIFHNIKTKEVETVVTDENGEQKTVKESLRTFEKPASYTFMFDAGCEYWVPDPVRNAAYLHSMQELANQRIRERARGNGGRAYMFVSEVLGDMFPRVSLPKWTYICGWIYDEKNPVGDNYIDFGVFHSDLEPTKRFVKGLEANVLLDFNCDGVIYDLI